MRSYQVQYISRDQFWNLLKLRHRLVERSMLHRECMMLHHFFSEGINVPVTCSSWVIDLLPMFKKANLSFNCDASISNDATSCLNFLDYLGCEPLPFRMLHYLIDKNLVHLLKALIKYGMRCDWIQNGHTLHSYMMSRYNWKYVDKDTRNLCHMLADTFADTFADSVAKGG